MFGGMPKYRILTKQDISINGIVEDEPEIISYARERHMHVHCMFPLTFKKVVAKPEKVSDDDIPYKEGDVVMVDLQGRAYLKKGHEVELFGKIYELELKKKDMSVLVFQGKKVFNETLGFSLDY